MRNKIIAAAVAVVAVILVLRSVFVVSPTQYVIVTQFGKPIRTITQAGLYGKLPYQSRLVFDNRLQVYDPKPFELYTLSGEDASEGESPSVGENVDVDVYVCWRIGEPLKFLQRVVAFGDPEFYLYDLVRSELSAIVAKSRLSELLRTDEPSRIPEIGREVTARCRDIAWDRYGIEIVDARVKRLNFPAQNRPSVFERMRAEREREAARYRAEGEGQATAIKAEADKEVQELLAEARKKAEMIKGEADATATKIYGDAYSHAPEFYRFIRTLDAYRRFLDDKTTLVLSGDSDLLSLLVEPGISGSDVSVSVGEPGGGTRAPSESDPAGNVHVEEVD